MGFGTAMLLLCSYCDPVRTLAHAKNEGYSVVDYRVTDLPFGAYSSEPKVWFRQHCSAHPPGAVLYADCLICAEGLRRNFIACMTLALAIYHAESAAMLSICHQRTTTAAG
jgi:hypothetical protein